MQLVFTVPEGEQGIYSLGASGQGDTSQTTASIDATLWDWDPELGTHGDRWYAWHHYPASSGVDLSGVLSPGTYVLTGDLRNDGEAAGIDSATSGMASLDLEFSIVPEPGSMLLTLVSLLGGATARRKH